MTDLHKSLLRIASKRTKSVIPREVRRTPATHALEAAFATCLLALCLTPLTACQTPQPASTAISIDPTPIHTNVKRFGINLSGQSFYDSGQMLRNLTFRNPGFEGETWQSILHCKSVTPTTCTDENQYAVWPAGFLDGAHYELISGPNTGSSGTVTHSSAAQNNLGVTLTLANPPRPPTPGDFILVQIDKPGDAQAGWWTNLQGGATLSTEFNDLSPHTPGKQALRLIADAPDQTAAVSSYFDSLEGHSFVHLNGKITLTFRAKAISPNKFLTAKLERLDTRHGNHIFFSQLIPLTQTWQDFTFPIDAHDIPDAVGTVGLTFAVTHATALLDDVALTAAADPNNPTAFRNQVVQTLRDLRPGVLRYMDNGTDFGSSLDNMLAPPFARRRSGASTQLTLQEDIPLGLNEFLQLSKAVGAEPWYSMPPGTSPAEAVNLIEFLSAPATTRYGAIRAALGQPEPWTHVFSQIHLELGNEQWNHQSFAGATINDPTAYGRRAQAVFKAIRATPGYLPAHFDLVLGSWSTVPWWTQQELASTSGYDSVAVAPYLFNDFNDAHSTEAIFGPMLAQPEMLDARPDGYMAQNASLAKSTHLNIYEVNLGVLTGAPTITQSDLDHTIPSMGAGLAVADHMLLMLRELGAATQCLFALPEYLNNFSAPGPKRMVPLWGSVIDMGGPTNLRRPQYLAQQLVNAAILPTMLPTRITGLNPTWDQPESPNDKIKLAGAHLLQTFAFADGSKHSLILLNLSRTQTLPVSFTGPIKPSGLVQESRLTSTHITDSNEATSTVLPHTQSLHNFNPTTPYPLPPFSITTLIWQTP